ncbi:hypothetical protein TH25_02650 [Thalassospira profundimaris]|uniref:CRISPR-associated endoribonuclease Cas13a n=1 Tax=Thalassospira profundimaris TaxID=502049 RepID=A0A367XKP0_9PROT|nr:type VI-A CRISPR-associated RNA-guided ribonuclease Cas13a [Thalassospira profundimaris]RCK54224.1 hypothetical protein TH25_02650 [Thalassospira profundimaris]
MRIIKPYGRSHVEGVATEQPRRKLRLNTRPDISRDIPGFAQSHDALIIAQWISAIDKIATKPKPDQKPTQRQMNLRTTLGDAAWQHLMAKNLLPAAKDPAIREKLHLIWQSKIAPWGASRPQEEKRGKPTPKGGWYERFCGALSPEAITQNVARQIAKDIYDHLYVAAKRKGREPVKQGESSNKPGKFKPDRKLSLIEERAESIAKNALRPGTHAPCPWGQDDQAIYEQAGDVATKIYDDARDYLEDKKRRSGNRNTSSVQYLPRDLAVKILYAQYGRVFGPDTTIKAALDEQQSLFALHTAIKDCYHRLVNDARKRHILRILPRNMAALFRLVRAQYDNRDINALIRLGKVIHYHAGEQGKDEHHGIRDYWPSQQDIQNSRFWGSDGQADIKRHEAFSRIWRHIIALASRTLHDWADPDSQKFTGDDDDILMRAGAIESNVWDAGRYERKCDVLFGAQASLFCGAEDFEKATLKQAITGTGNLRNATFHFKGKARFENELQRLADDVPVDVQSAIAALWQKDAEGRTRQIAETLQAVLAGHFLSERQNRHILATLMAAMAQPGDVPLPRLRRVLARHDSICQRGRILPLPPCPDRAKLEESPALTCQYTVLKMLYDGPFRAWLAQQNSTILNHYIDSTIARTNKAAQDMNGRKLAPAEKDLITARAADIPRLSVDEKMVDFLGRLTAATATEMRVQRGYQSDGEKAQKQAGYIGEFECDVIARAFSDFLGQSGFDFVLKLKADTPKPDAAQCDVAALIAPGDVPALTPQAWQQVLYFILHLVPVDDASRLLHQTRKWQALEKKGKDKEVKKEKDKEVKKEDEKPDIADLQSVLMLYLDMHDAKFTGGAALHGIEKFAEFFVEKADFRAVFPPQSLQDQDRSIPRRGLREIVRFGHLPLLQHMSGTVKITHDNVVAWQTARTPDATGTSPIARRQKQREELHALAVERPARFRNADLHNYMHALVDVIKHRQLSAQVTLSDQVRLHRLMMGVLGRLVDYAGLWERDLYFVLLALLYHHGVTPDDVLKGQGKRKLADGQVVEALKPKNRKAAAPVGVFDDLDHYGIYQDDRQSIRNGLSHFNMLRGGTAPDLSHWVNQTRRLVAHDRKLKNAVAKSVIEMLAREGFDLDWTIEPDSGKHILRHGKIRTRQAQHFQKSRIRIEKKSAKPDKNDTVKIRENLHGDAMVERVARLFAARAQKYRDITTEKRLDHLFLKPKG